MRYKYLHDKVLLKAIDNMPIKEQYVKIVLLDRNDKELQEVQGIVSQGSLNITDQAARRNGSLTVIADSQENDITNLDSLFSINKRIRLEVGIKNTLLNEEYPDYQYDIFWFPLGMFIISNLNLSYSGEPASVTISLNLKDKIALLDGSEGGSIPCEIKDITTVEDGNIKTKLSYFDTIVELVNHWGEIPLEKILVLDVQEYSPSSIYTLDRELPLTLVTYAVLQENGKGVQYETRIKGSEPPESSTIVYEKNYVTGKPVGNKLLSFASPNAIPVAAGATVQSILDTIVKQMGNFEYFFDVDGNFIFQEKKNYLNTSYASTLVNEHELDSSNFIIDLDASSGVVYAFDNNNSIITSLSNNPAFDKIKNDFIVWGKTANSNSLIRYRLAIDKKPEIGNVYTNFLFYKDIINPKSPETSPIIKRALPYEKIEKREDLKNQIKTTSKAYFLEDEEKYVLYNSIEDDYLELEIYGTSEDKNKNGVPGIVAKNWRSEFYFSGLNNLKDGQPINSYQMDLIEEWPKVYDIQDNKFLNIEDPSSVTYYLDLIDSSNSSFAQISVENIGRRSKVENKDQKDVNCVFEYPLLDLYLIFKEEDDWEEQLNNIKKLGYNYFLVDSEMTEQFKNNYGFRSAYSYARDLLYQHTSFNEAISVATIPIFYLEPNQRISVQNDRAGIFGDYIINSISLPFDISGTMTLSCSRALGRI